MKHPARSRTSTALRAGHFPPGFRRAAALKMLGKKIRSIRESKDLSQAQLARMCGLSPIRLRSIESGEVNLTLATLLRFSQRLEATLAELTRGID